MAHEMSVAQYADREAVVGIVPLQTSRRVYTFLDLLFVAGATAIATWCYQQGLSVAMLLDLPHSLAATFGPIMIGTTLVSLVGVMSARYGIDHWLLSRALWGHVGTMILLVVVFAAAQGWSAVNADLYAGSIGLLLDQLGWHAALTNHTVFKLIALTCPALGLLVALKGIGAVRLATKLMGIALVVLGIMMLILILTTVDLVELWQSEPLSGAPATRSSFMLAVEWNLAFSLSWLMIIGAITRLVKSERASGGGLFVGYGFGSILFIVLGILVAFAAATKGQPMTGDPTGYLLELGGPVLGSLSLVLVGVANVSTTAVGLFGVAVSTKVLCPSWRYEWLCLGYAVLIGALTLWGGVLENFGTYLGFVGALNAPAITLLVVDYWVLRRQRIDLHAVFDTKEHDAYRYTRGVNIPAALAFAASLAAYLLVYDPIAYAPRATGLFNVFTATGLSAIVSAVVYLALAAIPAVRTYLQQDRESRSRLVPLKGYDEAPTG